MRAGPPAPAAVSQEAALKYFLLGAFASAFFLFGMALLYGFAGAVDFGGIHDAALDVGATATLLLFAGLALVAVGLLFKIAAVPFHVWTPGRLPGRADAGHRVHGRLHQGGRVRWRCCGCSTWRSTGRSWDIEPILGAIAVLTMLVGAILAVTQTDIKRLLAYSSIANAGYLLVGVLAFSRDGLSSTMFYLVAYGFTVIAAFARRHAGPRRRRRGDPPVPLGRARPALAAGAPASSRS